MKLHCLVFYYDKIFDEAGSEMSSVVELTFNRFSEFRTVMAYLII